MADVPARLDDERPDAESADGVIDDPPAGVEDDTARRRHATVDDSARQAFGHQVAAKPKFSSRVPSTYMFGSSSSTAMSVRPCRVAETARHGPDLCVYPV